MNRIIALSVALVASLLAVLVPATPAHAAADCSRHTSAWTSHSFSKDEGLGDGKAVTVSAQIEYRFCVGDNSSWYKVIELRGRYVTSGTSLDCSDNYGADFTGVTYNWTTRMMGGYEPPPFKVACDPDTVGQRTVNVDADTNRVDSRNLPNPPWGVDMTVNTTQYADESQFRYGYL